MAPQISIVLRCRLLVGVIVILSALTPSGGRPDVVANELPANFDVNVVIVSLCASLLVSSAAIYGICCWNRKKKVQNHGDVESTKASANTEMTVRQVYADPSSDGVTNNGTHHEPVTVRLVNGSSSDSSCGLGFNVCEDNKTGAIFVCEVLKNGPAKLCGRIHPGDRLLSLKVSTECMELEDALTILSYASPYPVELCIQPATDSFRASKELGRMSSTAGLRGSQLLAVRRGQSVRYRSADMLDDDTAVVSSIIGDQTHQPPARSRDDAPYDIPSIDGDQGLATFVRQPIQTSQSFDDEVEHASTTDVPRNPRQKIMLDSAIDLETDASTIDLSLKYTSCELHATSADDGWIITDDVRTVETVQSVNDANATVRRTSVAGLRRDDVSDASSNDEAVGDHFRHIGPKSRSHDSSVAEVDVNRDVDENNNIERDSGDSVVFETDSEETRSQNARLNNLLQLRRSAAGRTPLHSAGSAADGVSTGSRSEFPLSSSSIIPDEIDRTTPSSDQHATKIHPDVETVNTTNFRTAVLPASSSGTYADRLSSASDESEFQPCDPLKSVETDVISEGGDRDLEDRDVVGSPPPATSAVAAAASTVSPSFEFVGTHSTNHDVQTTISTLLPTVDDNQLLATYDCNDTKHRDRDSSLVDRSRQDSSETMSDIAHDPTFHEINLNDDEPSAAGDVTQQHRLGGGRSSASAQSVVGKKHRKATPLKFGAKFRNVWSTGSLDRKPRTQRQISRRHQITTSSDDISKQDVGELKTGDEDIIKITVFEISSAPGHVKVSGREGSKELSTKLQPLRSASSNSALGETSSIGMGRSLSSTEAFEAQEQSEEQSLDVSWKREPEKAQIKDEKHSKEQSRAQEGGADGVDGEDVTAGDVMGVGRTAALNATSASTWLESCLRLDNDSGAATVCWTEVSLDENNSSTPFQNYSYGSASSTEDLSVSALTASADRPTSTDNEDSGDAFLFGAVKYEREGSSSMRTDRQPDVVSSLATAPVEESGLATAGSPFVSEFISSSIFNERVVSETSSPDDDVIGATSASTTMATSVEMPREAAESWTEKETSSNATHRGHVDLDQNSETVSPHPRLPPVTANADVNPSTATSSRTEIDVRVTTVDVKHVEMVLLPVASKEIMLLTSNEQPTTDERDPSIFITNYNNNKQVVFQVTSPTTKDTPPHDQATELDTRYQPITLSENLGEASRDDEARSASANWWTPGSSEPNGNRSIADATTTLEFPDFDEATDPTPVDDRPLHQMNDDSEEFHRRDFVRQLPMTSHDSGAIPDDGDVYYHDDKQTESAFSTSTADAVLNFRRSTPLSSSKIKISELTVRLKNSGSAARNVASFPSRISLRRRPRRGRIVCLTRQMVPPSHSAHSLNQAP